LDLVSVFAGISISALLGVGGSSNAVPAPADIQPPVQQMEEPVVMVVQPGDFLSKIAEKYQTTWRRLYDANANIKHPDIINPGDQLRIPKSDEQLVQRLLPNDTAPVISTVSKVKQQPKNTQPAVSDGSVWDRLAQCESGGNWAINTGNGYYGGLQFTLSTWRRVGGSGYPHEASREEQIARGQILQARSGWGQWPACAKKLGLP